MSEFWSSALNYFGGGSDSSGGSRFVGQTVDLGEGNKLRVKKVIAEGEKSTSSLENTHERVSLIHGLYKAMS